MKNIREICTTALLGLLRPIIRYCIRHSLKQRELIEYMKLVYVEIAREEIQKLKTDPTPSKISVMTGIQRREVSRLLSSDPTTRPNRDVISRVIGLWQGSARYKDGKGHPKVLQFTGREGEFADLVSEVSTDLNPYTVAFELERAKMALQSDQGIKLLKGGYEPVEDAEESLRLLSEDSENLHAAVLENIFSAEPIKNLHVKTQFDNIPNVFASEIRTWFLEQGGNFHHKAREFLSKFDRDLNPELRKKYADTPSLRATIGTVSYTEQVNLEQRPEYPRKSRNKI